MAENPMQIALTDHIASANCECGHGILAHHVNKCNWRPPSEDPGQALRNQIWGPVCPCEKSDALCLAELFQALMRQMTDDVVAEVVGLMERAK